MQTGANNVVTLLLGRIVAGVAVGYTTFLSCNTSLVNWSHLDVYR